LQPPEPGRRVGNAVATPRMWPLPLPVLFSLFFFLALSLSLSLSAERNFHGSEGGIATQTPRPSRSLSPPSLAHGVDIAIEALSIASPTQPDWLLSGGCQRYAQAPRALHLLKAALRACGADESTDVTASCVEP